MFDVFYFRFSLKNLTLDGNKTPPKQNGTVRYTWIRVALFNRVLATIIAYLVRHSRYDVVITSNVYNIRTHQGWSCNTSNGYQSTTGYLSGQQGISWPFLCLIIVSRFFKTTKLSSCVCLFIFTWYEFWIPHANWIVFSYRTKLNWNSSGTW